MPGLLGKFEHRGAAADPGWTRGEGHLPKCNHSKGAGSGVHSKVYSTQLRGSALPGF